MNDIDAVIDSKLNEKIKEQLNEINEIQETINRLKDGQPIVSIIWVPKFQFIGLSGLKLKISVC